MKFEYAFNTRLCHYRDPVKITVFRYIMKKVATNTNSKEIFDFYDKQRKLKKIKKGQFYEKRTDVRT